MIFETDLDYSRLDSFSEEELMQYIKDNFLSSNIAYDSGFSFRQTVKVMKAVCGMLKITPSNEQWVFLLADCERLLCEACAGAGKTTMAQLRAIKDKLVHRTPGNNILALAYNTHAVEDMKQRHSAIITRINRKGIPEYTRDTQICCHTFHSFCKAWVEDYISQFGIQNKNTYLMSDIDKHKAMNMAIESYGRQVKRSFFISDAIIGSLLSVYSFTKETITENNQEAWKLCPNLSDLTEMQTEDIAKIFAMYEKWKKLQHKLDFTDLVDCMYKLCCDPAVMRRIRANYKVFILDEYQDFTPSMLRIIKLIMEGDPQFGIGPFTDSRLTCIGDGDQSIYGFRGTDPDNCIRFKDTFSSPGLLVKVTAMSENRRCPEEVLEYARPVIESNAMRINKPIRSIHDGGSVCINHYQNAIDEMETIVGKLKLLSAIDYKNTCICYRNQSSSFLLGLYLVEAGIPFHIAKGHAPLTDKLSQALFEVLDMLSYPDVTSYVEKALFKVIPKSSTFTKASIQKMLETEEASRNSGGEVLPFFKLPFPDTAQRLNGFKDALHILEQARMAHRNNKPMSSYVPALIYLIRKYYLDWQLTKSNLLTDDYIQYITNWFGRDKTYDDFMKEYRKIIGGMEDNVGKGVCLTTLHGLKGLEFNNVYIIDLNDNIFPGTELQQSASLTAEQKDRLECEARRLFYVALTRAKNSLELFFDNALPSRYIRFFTKNTGLAKDYQNYMAEDDGYLVTDLDTSVDNTVQDALPFDIDEDMDFDVSLAESVTSSEECVTEEVTDVQPFETQSQVFSSIITPEEKVEQAIGSEKYASIRNKSVVTNILNRFLSEGDT